MRFILAALLFSLASAQAILIPASRMTDWTPGVRVGVPGGIINRTGPIINVTQAPYNAPVNTASDCQPAIQAAINAASAGSVVFMPAGTYRLNSSLSMGNSRDNITLRGAGMNSTILDYRGGSDAAMGVGWGNGVNWDWPPNSERIVTSGLTLNSTSIVLANATNFSVGQLIRINFNDREDTASIQAGKPPIGTGRHWGLTLNGSGNLSQTVRITAKAGNTLTIFPPIYGDNADIATGAQVTTTQGTQIEFAGLEAFTLSLENNPKPVGLQGAGMYGCWFLDVKVIGATNYTFQAYDSLQSEYRRTFASGVGGSSSNGAGYLIQASCGMLYEDNIAYNAFPLWEVNFSSAGNVIAYNYSESSSSISMLINHGPQNHMNLYEGNISNNIISDGFFGGSSEDTIFRNWFHGRDSYTTSFKRLTRNLNLIGNIIGVTGGPTQDGFSFGQPNIGNGSSSGTAQPTLGDFWDDFNATGTLTARTSDGTGTITLNGAARFQAFEHYFAITWGDGTLYRSAKAEAPSITNTSSFIEYTGGNAVLPAVGTALQVHLMATGGGFQELDLDVEASALQKGNWFAGTGYRAGTIGLDTIPASLFRSSKPAYFGNLTWPPFEPTTGVQGDTRIPAGYRFINGVDPPGGVDTTPPVLTSKNIGASGTTITLGFDEGVSVGLGGNGGWTISMSGGAATLSYASGAGSTALVYNISRTIGAGETGTVSYTQPGNGLEDGSGNDLVTLSNSTVTNGSSSDGVAPTPNPSTFSVAPNATGTTTITMTATTATDAGSPPVQYSFDETTGGSGGTDSGWQSSPTYVDTGLLPGTLYTYRVQARDSAAVPNTTTFSAGFSATTTGAAGARPATPGRSQRSNIVNP